MHLPMAWVILHGGSSRAGALALSVVVKVREALTGPVSLVSLQLSGCIHRSLMKHDESSRQGLNAPDREHLVAVQRPLAE